MEESLLTIAAKTNFDGARPVNPIFDVSLTQINAERGARARRPPFFSFL